MDVNLNDLTLAALLTTVGATLLASIVTGLVSVLGRLFRIAGHEAKLAAVIALVFVLVLSVQAVISEAMALGVPLLLASVIGWYSVTRIAMALYDDLTNQPGSLRNQV